jgi:glycosyltransferase involved in cell wall biosynthesis
MKKKMAIISICNQYKYGGIATLLNTAYRFYQQYFDPTIFVVNFDSSISTSIRRLHFSSSFRSIIHNEKKYIEVGARWAFWEPGHYAYNLHHWKQLLSSYHYFFVVSGNPVAGYPLAQLEKKFIMWITTSYEDDRKQRFEEMQGARKLISWCAKNPMKKIEQHCLLQAEQILALSTYAKKSFEKISLPKNPIILCPYPVNIKPINNEKKNNNTLISVGRFSDPRKNVSMLLKTFFLLRKKFPSLTLYVVGSRPMSCQLNTIPQSHLKNVIFTGNVSSEQLDSLYQTAYLKLVTSHQEGFGIAALDALAHGIPVVSTDCGGISDFVIHGKTGFLVPVNDNKTMAMYVEKLLEDKNIYETCSHQTQKLVKQHFSYQHVYALLKNTIINVYPETHNQFSYECYCN